ncbi:MAG: type II methionyl aminopeptidase [Candidatus Aenigmarchaeota archaeon]|nr:type II methionyl aminopeptidase [Candidatus Aenigmarchaeota archaeon]
MDDEDRITKFKQAGRIISEVREESRKFIKEGMLFSAVAEKIENLIREKGASPGFPACLSANEIAAHYSPGKNDQSCIPEGALLKVDIGAHVDGYVADTAYTIAFNDEHKQLAEASAAALNAAIEQSYTGNLLSNVSEAIEGTIKDFGFNPISNLTGHGLGHYWLHDAPSVPNVKFTSAYQLKEGHAIAIEPFATTGAGKVKDAESITIFRIDQPKPVRNMEARRIIEFAAGLRGLPFSERWLPVESLFKLKMALRELREREILYEYPALKEISNGLVSQAEHSVIVSDKPIVITK